jgi:response regulator RpfG family c-di-GMP phosphodiesterase
MPGQIQGSQSKKILLIEGHSLVRIALHKVLKAYGHVVKALETGEEGILTVLECEYDVVICNQNLSGISGLGFFAKALPFLAQSTTVLTTGCADDFLANKAHELGINVFVEKPFKIENLMECINTENAGPMTYLKVGHIYATNYGKIIPICQSGTGPLPADKDALQSCIGKPVNRKGRKWIVYQNRNNFGAKLDQGSPAL